MIYLDNAATTPITQPVLEAMIPYLTTAYGNPSTLYTLGREAKIAIEAAREQVAKAINAKPNQIFFTSGATEANNWVLSLYKTVVCSDIEHHSIISNPKCISMPIEIMFDLGTRYLPELFTAMYVNNETGNVLPIKEMAKKAHKLGTSFHTDATQAFGHLPIDVSDLDVDSLSLSGHKFHAPKGVGILYMKCPNTLTSFLYGGSQERGKRAGTENVASIVGIGKACELYNYNVNTSKFEYSLREELIKNLSAILNIRFNSDLNNSIPTTLNVSFKGIESESLMLLLDNKGIFVSAGSACTSGSPEPSHVLKAIGVPEEYLYGTIRISLSENNTKDEISKVASEITKYVNMLRLTRT